MPNTCFILIDARHRNTGSGSSASSTSNSNHSPHPQHNSNSNNGSGGGGSGSGYTAQPYQGNSRMRHSSSISSSSEFTSVSQQVPGDVGNHTIPTPPKGIIQNHSPSPRSGSDKELDRVSVRSVRLGASRRGRRLGVAAHLAQSRESFQLALDNPCQYFVGGHARSCEVTASWF